MAGTFNLQIVTPEREVFNGPVESVTLPGMESRFGVLRNHAPIIAALEAGLVELYDEQAQRHRLAVGGGFFQVADNQGIILADSAELGADIDKTRAAASEQRARSRLDGKLEPASEMQRERAEAALKRARARLRVAGG